MNSLADLINMLSPGLMSLLNLYKSALSPAPQQQGAFSQGGLMYAGGQQLPGGGYQAGPISYTPPAPAQTYAPAYPPAQQYGPPQPKTTVNFNPTIVQNQYNSLPLHSSGGINATMNASTSLNTSGMRV